jgi:hypothetical protein
MPKILIRAGKRPDAVLTPEASLAASRWSVFGRNSGNLLFSNSVTRALSVPGAELVPDSLTLERTEPTAALAARIDEEFDALVLPLANAFRPDFVGALTRLTRLIERLTIPVVVVGAGAQLPVGGSAGSVGDDVKDATRAFVHAVLERSASVGVRGAITERFLTDLGIPADSIDVIGCPSIFDAGRSFTVRRKADAITPDSAVAFNTAMANPGAGAFVRRITDAYPRSVFIGQSNLELELLLWGTPISGQQAGVPASTDHPLWAGDRLRFFVDPRSWIGYLAGRDLSVGARIHGNVAALLAGTPAVVLAADSRTLELADHHAIPHRVMPRLDADLDLDRLHAEIDLDAFNRLVPENFDRYCAFLDRNGLAHAAGDAAATARFDARMAAAPFPGPVGPPTGPDGVRELLDRLRWLRQTNPTPDVRTSDAYVPPFAPDPVAAALQPLVARIAELERARDRRRRALDPRAWARLAGRAVQRVGGPVAPLAQRGRPGNRTA